MATMPVTLTLGQLVKAKPALERLITMVWSMIISFRLSRRLRIMMEEIATYEQKFSALVSDYGAPVEGKPGQIGVFQNLVDPETKEFKPNPKWAEFNAKCDELNSIEVTLAFEPIKIEDLQPLKIVTEVICPKCGEKTIIEKEQTVSIDDMFLLYPLLADETPTEGPRP